MVFYFLFITKSILLASIILQISSAFIVQGSDSKLSDNEPNLSPFELAMFSDLVVQISLFRCPAVNRPAVKSMKKFVLSTFSKAPEKAVAHPLFYSNYRSLVECLNYAEAHFPKRFFAHLDQGSFQIDANREKRQVDSLSEEFNGLIPKKDRIGRLLSMATEKTNPFETIFTEFYKIVKNTCPAEFSPDADFLRGSLTEVVDWITKHEMVNQAKEKYFDRSGLLKQVHKCSKLIVN